MTRDLTGLAFAANATTTTVEQSHPAALDQERKRAQVVPQHRQPMPCVTAHRLSAPRPIPTTC